jgi:hypothetical protein
LPVACGFLGLIALYCGANMGFFTCFSWGGREAALAAQGAQKGKDAPEAGA